MPDHRGIASDSEIQHAVKQGCIGLRNALKFISEPLEAIFTVRESIFAG